MPHTAALRTLILHDPERLRLLSLVRALKLPDCWIAAGFVRNAVWDHLHDRAPAPPSGDVDIIWYDPDHGGAELDLQLEHALRLDDASIAWSVKNQARMHVRNGDLPYACATDAMRAWPETATAVAVRLQQDGSVEVAAPYGLADLYAAILRPGLNFHDAKRRVFDQRIEQKQWLARWPRLQTVAI